MNRRSFLQMVIGTVATIGFAPDALKLLEDTPVPEVTLPPVTVPTLRRLIDVICVGQGVELGEVPVPTTLKLCRPNGDCVTGWRFHPLATFRWVAAPSRELVVPEGDFIAVHCSSQRTWTQLLYDDGTVEIYEGNRLTDIVSLGEPV